MKSVDAKLCYQRFLSLTLIVILTLLVLIYRRPDQFLHPYIWAEDKLDLQDFITSGWLSIFHPLVGYFILPTKLIFALSATLSFRWWPEISYWLTLAFTATTLTAIALSPTQLKNRPICALAVLFIPTDSEVFAVSLYAGWWGTLLAMLPLLWRNEGPQRYWLRLGLLILGGLSSPLIIGLAPLYAVRAWALKTRVAAIDLAVSVALAAIQAISLIANAATPKPATLDFSVPILIDKFFGNYLYISGAATHMPYHFAFGLFFLGLLTVLSVIYRKRLGFSFFLLCGSFVIAVVFVIARVALSSIHPSLAGPRYFFLPFIFLSWIVVQLASIEARFPQLAGVVILAIATRNAVDVAQRHHDTIDWREQLESCMQADQFTLLIHMAGDVHQPWYAGISGEDCHRLISQSWFDNNTSGAIRTQK